jgi:hypothetical protein
MSATDDAVSTLDRLAELADEHGDSSGARVARMAAAVARVRAADEEADALAALDRLAVVCERDGIEGAGLVRTARSVAVDLLRR